MNKHKQKCDKLKQVRKEIADKIGVDLHQKECTFSGECTGTCPKCKQEEDILNKALLKKVGIAALSAGVTFSLTACGTKPNPDDLIMGIATPEIETTEPLQGGVEAPSKDATLSGDVETVTVNNSETCIDDTSCETKQNEEPAMGEDVGEESTELPLEPLMGAAPYEGD